MYNERFNIDSTIRRPEGSCRVGYGEGVSLSYMNAI